MKAIHNKDIATCKEYVIGNYKLKYNFESNSQRIFLINRVYIYWEL
nr:hypothetical protein [Flavobacterium laiguense]